VSNQTIAVGMTLVFTNLASDSDDDPLTFSLGAGAATNTSLNPATGVFTWTPTQAQIGSNAFSVIVSDNGLPPLSATQSFVVTVVASNNPPVLAPIADQTIHALMPLTLTASATDPDAPPQVLTFSLDPGAPASSSIGPTSGVLAWTPSDSQIGSNVITVRVTGDGLPNLNDPKTFTASVLARPTLKVIRLSDNGIAFTL